MSGLVLWRVFPWDRAAALGSPYSASHVAAGQTSGRFDLHDRPPVLYLAESAEHAVAELIQGFRGRTIGAPHLRRHGHPLALVEVELPEEVASQVADCTDPLVLARLEVRPDALASHQRLETQGIARQLHSRGEAGFRWWSTLTGSWHTTILFLDRVAVDRLSWREPVVVGAKSPAFVAAAEFLGIDLA